MTILEPWSGVFLKNIYLYFVMLRQNEIVNVIISTDPPSTAPITLSSCYVEDETDNKVKEQRGPLTPDKRIVFSISDTEYSSPNDSFNVFRKRWVSPSPSDIVYDAPKVSYKVDNYDDDNNDDNVSSVVLEAELKLQKKVPIEQLTIIDDDLDSGFGDVNNVVSNVNNVVSNVVGNVNNVIDDVNNVVVDDDDHDDDHHSIPSLQQQRKRMVKNRLESFNNVQVWVNSEQFSTFLKGSRLENKTFLPPLPLPPHYPKNVIKIDSHLISIHNVSDIIKEIEDDGSFENDNNNSFEECLYLWMKEKQIPPYDCFHFVFIGLESFSQQRLSQQNKEMRRIIGESVNGYGAGAGNGNGNGDIDSNGNGTTIITATLATNTARDPLIPKLLDLENIFWMIQLQLKCSQMHFLAKKELIPSCIDAIADSIAWKPHSSSNDTDKNRAVGNRGKRIPANHSLCWKAMLQEIKGISNVVAESIFCTFPTISSLMQRYLECDNDRIITDGSNCGNGNIGNTLLSQIMSDNRAIGSAISKKVYKCLWSGNGGDLAYE